MEPLDIKIQTLEDDYLRMQIKDDPYTLYNLLRIVALDLDGVTLAGYARDRTFEESVMFQIRTDGSINPEDAVIEAAREIMDMANDFRQSFEDAFPPI